MCYAKPGPRCTPHAAEKLKNAIESGDQIKIFSAQDEYDETAGGQKALKDIIVNTVEKNQKIEYQARLDAGLSRRRIKRELYDKHYTRKSNLNKEKEQLFKQKMKHIFYTIDNEEMPSETKAVIINYVKRYGEPSIGRERAVFDRGDGFVLKIAYAQGGYTSNGRERMSSAVQNEGKDLYIPVANNYWHSEPALDPQEQTSILCMEKVVPTTLSYAELPEWVQSVDGAQVGLDSKGNLVAYDL